MCISCMQLLSYNMYVSRYRCTDIYGSHWTLWPVPHSARHVFISAVRRPSLSQFLCWVAHINTCQAGRGACHGVQWLPQTNKRDSSWALYINICHIHSNIKHYVYIKYVYIYILHHMHPARHVFVCVVRQPSVAQPWRWGLNGCLTLAFSVEFEKDCAFDTTGRGSAGWVTLTAVNFWSLL